MAKGSKMLFNSSFLLTCNEYSDNNLETFQMLGKITKLSGSTLTGCRCEGLVLLHLYLQMLNNKLSKPYV